MEQLPHQESVEQKQERIKFTVSKFLEDKLVQAIQLKKEAIVRSEDVDIVQCLQNVWPQHDGLSWQKKPRFTVPDLGEDVTIRFDLHSDFDEVNRILTINIGDLREAETPEELDEIYLKVLEDVYHETEHLYTPGSHLEPEDIQETIEYLGNPGEIEAHGRQFAFRYTREFPGEPFDITKMAVLAEQIKQRGGGNKHYNYFVVFADPAKQEKYKEFGDVKSIYEKIVTATERHMQILTSLN